MALQNFTACLPSSFFQMARPAGSNVLAKAGQACKAVTASPAEHHRPSGANDPDVAGHWPTPTRPPLCPALPHPQCGLPHPALSAAQPRQNPPLLLALCRLRCQRQQLRQPQGHLPAPGLVLEWSQPARAQSGAAAGPRPALSLATLVPRLAWVAEQLQGARSLHLLSWVVGHYRLSPAGLSAAAGCC